MRKLITLLLIFGVILLPGFVFSQDNSTDVPENPLYDPPNLPDYLSDTISQQETAAVVELNQLRKRFGLDHLVWVEQERLTARSLAEKIAANGYAANFNDHRDRTLDEIVPPSDTFMKNALDRWMKVHSKRMLLLDEIIKAASCGIAHTPAGEKVIVIFFFTEGESLTISEEISKTFWNYAINLSFGMSKYVIRSKLEDLASTRPAALTEILHDSPTLRRMWMDRWAGLVELFQSAQGDQICISLDETDAYSVRLQFGVLPPFQGGLVGRSYKVPRLEIPDVITRLTETYGEAVVKDENEQVFFSEKGITLVMNDTDQYQGIYILEIDPQYLRSVIRREIDAHDWIGELPTVAEIVEIAKSKYIETGRLNLIAYPLWEIRRAQPD